jgi:hypothetical protein
MLLYQNYNILLILANKHLIRIKLRTVFIVLNHLQTSLKWFFEEKSDFNDDLE